MQGIWMKSGVCAAICFLFMPIALASSAIFSNLIVFGDSLSDAASLSLERNMAKEKEVGNNYWVKSNGKIGAPVTNIDVFSQSSPLWPNELMADSSLLDPNPNNTRYIYPSRQASQKGYSPLRYSIDYAWASAETGEHYVNDLNPHYAYNDRYCQNFGPGYISPESACVPGVLLQVKNYLREVSNHPNPHSLIMIWAGANDIFNNIAKVAVQNTQSSLPLLFLKMLTVPFPLDTANTAGQEPLSNPIKNLKQAVILLLQAGVPAQNIYVVNLPNLAKTPASQDFAKDRKSLLYTLTAITEMYNIALRTNLAFNYLNPQFNLPNGNIISADQSFKNILQNHQKYGFNKLLADCVKDGAAPECRGYIFFNGKHATTAVQKIVAEYVKQILHSSRSKN